jgi:hypothetical protein
LLDSSMSPFHKGFWGDVCGTWLDYLFWKAIFVGRIRSRIHK